MKALVVPLFFALVGAGFAQSSAHPDAYQVVNTYPHDSGAFTQGLVYLGGHLYESTGRKGRSSVRMVDLATGNVLQKFDLPGEYFGEGLTEKS